MKKLTSRQELILLKINGTPHSIDELISNGVIGDVTSRTIQRDFKALEERNLVTKSGSARSTKYKANLKSISPISISAQTLDEIMNSERKEVSYNFEFLDSINNFAYEQKTQDHLIQVTHSFNSRKNDFVDVLKNKELERIIVEISWKSSSMEGNTYSLLETENLLKYGIAPDKRNNLETQMILGHKKALDFVINNANEFQNKIRPAAIIETHKILTEGLGITPGIRASGVAITASSYTPLGNQHQLNEELNRLCEILSNMTNGYHKAFTAFVYIAYLQPFNDGNKRAARIISNALLNANDLIPISFRSIDLTKYISSLILYYEYGIFGNMNDVFVEQIDYTNNNYYKSDS